MASSREQAPEFVRWLVEPETLKTAGCERRIAWLLPSDLWQGPEAEALREMVSAPSPGRRAALSVALGYEFDPRRLRFEELARRMVIGEMFRAAGIDRLMLSPVLYQSRPRWDIYAPRLRALAIVNHLAAEKDVLGHLQHSGLRFVLWAPDPSERAQPDKWYALRYDALNPPDPSQRNWFDETVRQSEQESQTRRRLTLELKNGEKDLPIAQETIAAFRAAIQNTLGSYPVTMGT
ncbi:MAG TPA: hypothetical protein VFZ25_08665 [Chloroflexota bacterium]|nr:hypothetical protein [Chloroflexota bacterium]